MEKAPEYSDNKKVFNFILIGIGLIFLIDYNINTIDILPDFIALILISAGIGRLYYINENLAKAKNYINYFFIVSVIKLIWNIIYIIFDSRMFDSSLILLFATLFSTAEMILSILIFINIFKGIESFFQIGEQNENDSFMVHAKKSDYILLLLKIFFILKFILVLFIQLPVLLTDVNWDNLSMVFDMYLNSDFVKNLFIPPCFIIQTLLGIFVLSFYIPFFLEISKDKELYEFLKSKINRMLISNHFFILKQTLSFAFIFFIAGSIFFIDLQFDNINFLPDFVICIIFLIGIFILTSKNPDIINKKLNLYLIINIPVSVCSYIYNMLYKIESSKSFTGENVELIQMLRIVSNVSYQISIILFFLIFIEFYYFIKTFQNKYLEFSVRYLNKYLTSSEKILYKNKNIIFITAAMIFCIKALSPVLPQSGIVLFCHSLILIAFVFFVIKGLFSIRDAVYSYYK